MGIRRFTYTLRADVADKEVVSLAAKHATEADEELMAEVEYVIGDSHPVLLSGQLYYTITITITWQGLDDLV